VIAISPGRGGGRGESLIADLLWNILHVQLAKDDEETGEDGKKDSKKDGKVVLPPSARVVCLGTLYLIVCFVLRSTGWQGQGQRKEEKGKRRRKC